MVSYGTHISAYVNSSWVVVRDSLGCTDVRRADYVLDDGTVWRWNGGGYDYIGDLVDLYEVYYTDPDYYAFLLEQLFFHMGVEGVGFLLPEDVETYDVVCDLIWLPSEPDPYAGVYLVEKVWTGSHYDLREVR